MLPKYHTRHIAGIRYQILIAGILLLLTSCWEKQDHVVSPPSHPTYRLSGTVSYTLSDRPVSAADLSLIMTELYQGDFMDTLLTQTDESGYYQFEGLYRGRYDIHVLDAGDTLFSGELGIIKYEDKIYNISISEPDSLSDNQ